MREIVEIPVERIDPAEALRRIRADVEASLCLHVGCERRSAFIDLLAIMDHHWPNGAPDA